MKYILWFCELLINWLRQRNNIMSQEIEEAIQRNKEHQSRLDELQKLNQDYENKLEEQRKLSNELFTSLQSEWKKVEKLEQQQRDAVISKTDKEILREKI